MSAARERAAWAWTRHLLDGGTTPWAAWVAGSAAQEPGGDDPPAGWRPPGAAQLELVRRVNAHRGSATARHVADLVLARSGPGRGLGQQPLLWPGEPVASYGAPPVDPVDVPHDELVRVGVGALTELLLATPDESLSPPKQPRRRRWTRGPAFEVAGAPVTAAEVRAAIGVPEGGRDPKVLVVGGAFDTLLAQVWSSRVQRGAPVRWAGFVERWSGRAALPPSTDLPALAAHWAGRVGRENVHVVVPGEGTDPPAVARDLLGRPGRSPLPPRWAALDPATVDVLRRVNAVLSVRVDDARHRFLARGLAEQLADGSGSLTVPEAFEGWARERATRLAADLVAGGYPVHGDLADLAPRLQGPRRPDLGAVLDRVVRGCLRLAAQRKEAA